MNRSENWIPLRVPERSIPVPQSISRQARAVLSRAGEAPFVWPPYPAPDDHDAWFEYADAANVNMKAMIDALPEPGDSAEAETLRAGEISLFRVSGGGEAPALSGNVLFDIHGGALIAGGGELCRIMACRAAARTGATVYAPDYRLPPLYPYPVPLDDCLTAYRRVIADHPPDRVIVRGSSAGGNLAAALMLRAKAEGLPLPAGLILETPELDLTESGDSFQTNMIVDVVLQRSLGPANRLYANGHDLADPHLSPLFADFSGGWPPTLITAGTRDMFLSNAVRMLHRLRDADVPVELLVYEAMPHGGFFGTPEDQRLARDIQKFAQRCWHRTGA
jgi:acetyl esterase/lipase